MKFPVVTICGSTHYYLPMIRYAEMMTAQGLIVLMPHSSGWEEAALEKGMLDEMHLEKIDMANTIAVIGGYKEDTTKNQIEYARSTLTPIAYMPVPATPEAVTALVAEITKLGPEIEPKI